MEVLKQKLPDEDSLVDEALIEESKEDIDKELELFKKNREAKIESEKKSTEKISDDSYFSELQEVIKNLLPKEEEIGAILDTDIDEEFESVITKNVSSVKTHSEENEEIEDSYFSGLQEIIEEKLPKEEIIEKSNIIEENIDEEFESFINSRNNNLKEEEQKEENEEIEDSYFSELQETIKELLPDEEEKEEIGEILDNDIDIFKNQLSDDTLENKIEQETLESSYFEGLQDVLKENLESDNIEEIIEDVVTENNNEVKKEVIEDIKESKDNEEENNKTEKINNIKTESIINKEYLKKEETPKEEVKLEEAGKEMRKKQIVIPTSLDSDMDNIRNKYSKAFKKNTKKKKKSKKQKNKTTQHININDISKSFNNYIKSKQKNKPTTSKTKTKEPKTTYNLTNIDEDDIDLGINVTDTYEDKQRRLNTINLYNKIKLRIAAIGIVTTIIASTIIAGTSGIFKNKKSIPTKYNNAKEKQKSIEETTKEPTVVQIAKGKNLSTLSNLSNTATNAQKNHMLNMSLYLTIYNGSFANKTEDSNHRAALRWDEVAALKLAYNNYTDDELKEIFNGQKLDHDTLYKDFNKASKQLVKAFKVDDRKYPVSLDVIIDSKSGKNKYYKINKYFENAKKSTGVEKEKNIKKFYKAAYKAMLNDNKKVEYNNIQLFIKPMVNAADKLFNKEEKPKRLAKKVNKYYNSDKLANNLINRYSKVEQTLAKTKVNNNIPLYSQFRHAKIRELKDNHWYNISDRNIDRKNSTNSSSSYSKTNYNSYKNTNNDYQYTYSKTEKTNIEETTKKEKETKKPITKKDNHTKETNKNKEVDKSIKISVNSRDYVSSKSTEQTSNKAEEATTNKIIENKTEEITTEEIANKIVEDMANNSYSEEEYTYQYTYTK